MIRTLQCTEYKARDNIYFKISYALIKYIYILIFYKKIYHYIFNILI